MSVEPIDLSLVMTSLPPFALSLSKGSRRPFDEAQDRLRQARTVS